MDRKSPLHTTPHVAAGSIPVPTAQMHSEVSQMLQLWLTITQKGPLSSGYPPWPGAHLTKAHVLWWPGGEPAKCKPKSPQVSGKLCLDSRPCLCLSPAHCTGLAPTRSQRSYSPRIPANEKKALCLLNESLRQINLLVCFFFFFLSKHRMQCL